MVQLLLETSYKKVELDNQLSNLVNEGFIFVNECYFLKKCYEQQRHISATDFIDKTGHECFINSLHVDDYIESDFIIQAILFVDEALAKWDDLEKNMQLEVILSETEFGINIKIHVIRENQQWINIDSINEFKEALMIYRTL